MLLQSALLAIWAAWMLPGCSRPGSSSTTSPAPARDGFVATAPLAPAAAAPEPAPSATDATEGAPLAAPPNCRSSELEKALAARHADELRVLDLAQARDAERAHDARALEARVDIVRGNYMECLKKMKQAPDPVCVAIAEGEPSRCPGEGGPGTASCPDLARWVRAVRAGDVDSCTQMADPASGAMCRAVLTDQWECGPLTGAAGAACRALAAGVDAATCDFDAAPVDKELACRMVRTIRAWTRRAPGYCLLVDAERARQECLAAVHRDTSHCGRAIEVPSACAEGLLDWQVRPESPGAGGTSETLPSVLAVRALNLPGGPASCTARIATKAGTRELALSPMLATPEVQVLTASWPADAGPPPAPSAEVLRLVCSWQAQP